MGHGSEKLLLKDEPVSPPVENLERKKSILNSTSIFPSAMNLNKFVQGYQRFHTKFFREEKELYEKLQLEQAPKTFLIGCCDSRVDPAIITDCDPGDIFVLRNIANIIPPYAPDDHFHGTSAALEYAVKVLEVESIIVLGHAKCGGIKALVEETVTGFEFIGSWMNIAREAKERVKKHFQHQSLEMQERTCEQVSILQSLERLLEYPWILKRLEDGNLKVHGWYFNFETGELLAYNSSSCKFEPMAAIDINRRTSVVGPPSNK